MQKIIIITLFATLVCGVGTSFGGILATSFRKSSNKIMSLIMGMAAGLMLSVVTFDLIPEAIEIGGFSRGIFGIAIGALFVIIIDILIPEDYISNRFGRESKMAFMLAIGLAAHNFPEGLAIGSGFIGGMDLGLKLSIVIALHDIPEGAAVASPLMQGRMKRWKILLFTALTALPTAVGAFIGATVSNISQNFIAICLAFAGGTMLYIVCGEMIPSSRSLFKGALSTIAILVGIILGMMITMQL